jgi:hypothetical protein
MRSLAGEVVPGLLPRWRNLAEKMQASTLAPVGVTVGVLDTGRSYADDFCLTASSTTIRAPSVPGRDAQEVCATKRAIHQYPADQPCRSSGPTLSCFTRAREYQISFERRQSSGSITVMGLSIPGTEFASAQMTSGVSTLVQPSARLAADLRRLAPPDHRQPPRIYGACDENVWDMHE